MPFDATPVESLVVKQLKIARTYVALAWCQHRSFGEKGARCAFGALTDFSEREEAKRYLRRALDERYSRTDVPTWQDMPDRTQADVLRLYDEAIALASADALP